MCDRDDRPVLEVARLFGTPAAALAGLLRWSRAGRVRRDGREAAFGGSTHWPRRAYIGSEACERLLPSDAEARRLEDVAAGRPDVRTTLVFPPASDATVERALRLVALMPSTGEVVVNDLGLGRALREARPTLQVVAGRLLLRNTRDPRVRTTPTTAHDEAGAIGTAFASLLARLGIGRIEMDLGQASAQPAPPPLGLHLSVHVTSRVVAVGPICVAGNLHLAQRDRFRAGNPCRRECLSIETHGVSRIGGVERVTFSVVGNAVLHRNGAPEMAALRLMRRVGIVDRVVVVDHGEP